MPINRATTVIDQGSYFTANNASTGVATTATPTSFSDTAPLFTIQNLASSGRSIYMDWVRGYCTVAGTAGVDLRLKLELDKTAPSGGTLLTAVNVNGNDGSVSQAAVRILPTGIAATGSQRIVIGQSIVIPTQAAVFTVGTEFNLKFGGVDGFGSQSVAVASQAAIVSKQMPPVVVAPGWSLQVPFLITSQSAASTWALEFGWVEF
jgi:hypothetical protein